MYKVARLVAAVSAAVLSASACFHYISIRSMLLTCVHVNYVSFKALLDHFITLLVCMCSSAASSEMMFSSCVAEVRRTPFIT